MTGDPGSIRVAFAGKLGNFSLAAKFNAPMSGITALFGPSGCGKTTILRCMAGLERLPGLLSVGGQVWQDDTVRVFRKPHERPVGYVFQEASLFQHLSVRRNLLYASRRANSNGGPTLIGKEEVIELLGIGSLLNRSPHALSGGERQRVAVGRALLSQPRLLLMDEPLSALDRVTKDEILPYFEALHAHLSIPILFVSHDIAEIERLADTLVLLEGGRVTAAGPLADLEANPDLPLVRAPEAAVTLDGRVAAIDAAYQLTRFEVPGGTLVVAGIQGTPGDARRLRVSASDVSFTLAPPADTTILNCLPARILSVTGQGNGGPQVNVIAALGEDGSGARIVALITRKSCDRLALRPGMAVFAQIKGVALIASGAPVGTTKSR
jgi:molybdate transport system ATP-binding protein